MPDPVPLTAVKVRIPPQESLIRMLEDLLEKAKDGRLQSCAFACVYSGDLEPGEKTGEGWSVADLTNFAMSHSLTLLQAQWQQNMLRRYSD